MRVRPGLSGIGSIIFHNEEEILDRSDNSVEFYDQVIAPYKGSLEEWYVENVGTIIYLKVILLTLWILVFSRSSLVRKVFPQLPSPPQELVELLL